MVHVPGAFEIPLAAQRLAETGEFDAIVCLGCLIKGDTMHFEYIAAACVAGDRAGGRRDRRADGVRRADDAHRGAGAERAGAGPGNKGREAALAAVEMADAVRALEQEIAA